MVGSHDLTIHQSPTILSSERDEGTTGAGICISGENSAQFFAHQITVVWNITPLVASWISSQNNALFRHQVLTSTSSVLELGCGISGVIAMVLAPLIGNYILTDQAYVMKLLNQNLSENCTCISSPTTKSRKINRKSKKGSISTSGNKQSTNITTTVLDWEANEIPSSLPAPGFGERGFDVVIACDCVYNDSLIQPLVQTCIDACQLRRMVSQNLPTLCIIAQQLRSDQVFDSWLKAFHRSFNVWRLPDTELTAELRSNTGFVVHCGILR